MRDLRQIHLINQQLEQKKSKIKFDLLKVHKQLEKKTQGYKRMLDYLNDYMDSEKLTLTRMLPNLNVNINLFIKKMNEIIYQTEIEIEDLKKAENIIQGQILEVDKKLDLMKLYEAKIKQAAEKAQEKRDQAIIDDAVATIEFRRQNE